MLTNTYARDEQMRREKMHSDDRVFILRIKDGKKPLSSIGLVDKRLFTNENRLHAIRDPRFSTWTLRYEQGSVPEKIKQTYVTFDDVIRYVTDYFNTRNIEIVDIEDCYD